MNHLPALRSAQSLAAAIISTPTRVLAASYRRAVVLGVLTVLGSTGAALAQDAPTVKTKQTDAHTLALTVENPAQQRMQMQVVSEVQNVRLVNEVNHLTSYGSKLAFNGMPAGQYTVLVRVGHERYRYHVQVAAQPQTSISVRELTPATAPESVASAAR